MDTSNIEWCVCCDLPITLGPEHRIIETSSWSRQIVTDGFRAHIVLKGGTRTQALKKLAAGAGHEKVILVYKDKPVDAPEVEPKVEPIDEQAPISEPPTSAAADTDWFSAMLVDGGVQ